MRTKQILLAAATLAIVTAGIGFDSGVTSSVMEASTFGNYHFALGSAELATTPTSLDVKFPNDLSTGGVAIEMANMDRLNVYMEPVEMPAGSYFETAVVGEVHNQRRVLGKITHNQVGPKTTEVGVDFTALKGIATDGRVTVATYVDDAKTFETSLSIDQAMTVGQVNSIRTGWAESYHWVCVNGSCSLMVDPEPAETITFAHDPSIQQPFNYLVFTIDGVESVVNPQTMEFTGSGLGWISIIGEDSEIALAP
ncbi:MAG: hypothetical protein R3282_00105 [Rhodothermales bacterium]|nr:hypothetical protein [Rhodothermales bacterium]